jgi:hypothetical protein
MSTEAQVIVDLVAALDALLMLGRRTAAPNELENAEVAALDAIKQARTYLNDKFYTVSQWPIGKVLDSAITEGSSL